MVVVFVFWLNLFFDVVAGVSMVDGFGEGVSVCASVGLGEGVRWCGAVFQKNFEMVVFCVSGSVVV